jgi:hypothetical protein
MFLALSPGLRIAADSNWTIYSAMTNLASKSVLVDSSKDPLIASMMYAKNPTQSFIIFLNRGIEGWIVSQLRAERRKGNSQTVGELIKRKQQN